VLIRMILANTLSIFESGSSFETDTISPMAQMAQTSLCNLSFSPL
jgi:hypothetical protein